MWRMVVKNKYEYMMCGVGIDFVSSFPVIYYNSLQGSFNDKSLPVF
jgi:hypothetical protein